MLKAERQRLYAVMEALPVYVALFTPDYYVSFANKFFRQRFGESQGRRCFEYLFKRDAPCEKCETRQVLKAKKPHHWEWIGPDGRDYDIYDFPFVEADGSIHIMEVGVDISDRKQAQEALLEAQKEMHKAKRLSDIGVLAATVAHELRNPLAAINMAAANIKKKAQNPLLEQHLLNIEKKVQESDRIINNLLFYSRIGPPHYENVNLNMIISDCVDSLRQQIQFKEKISVVNNFDLTKDILIEADPLQMGEVFYNVLNNACDALRDTGGKIEIFATTEVGTAHCAVPTIIGGDF